MKKWNCLVCSTQIQLRIHSVWNEKYIFILEQSIWAIVIFPSFFCQTKIFSTQEGMLRRACCFLGSEQKMCLSLIPALDTPHAVVQGQGWVLHLSPLRKLLPALLFPHALLWAAALPRKPRQADVAVGTAALPFLGSMWLSHSWHWVGDSSQSGAALAAQRLGCALGYGMGLCLKPPWWATSHQ